MSKQNITKAVLLNAPAKVGKSEAMKYLHRQGHNLTYRSCKDPLHQATMALFGVPKERYWSVYNDSELKETPLPEFKITLNTDDLHSLLLSVGCISLKDMGKFIEGHGGYYSSVSTLSLSLREAIIYTSEVIMKPRFRSNVFGLNRANSIQDGEVIIDDSAAAFDVNGKIVADEVYPLIDRIGNENILLIRIHREGFDFSGDSRRYVSNGVCENTIDIYNVNELEFYQEVDKVVTEFLSSSV